MWGGDEQDPAVSFSVGPEAGCLEMEKEMTTQLLTESAQNINGAAVPDVLRQRLAAHVRRILRKGNSILIQLPLSLSLLGSCLCRYHGVHTS